MSHLKYKAFYLSTLTDYTTSKHLLQATISLVQLGASLNTTTHASLASHTLHKVWLARLNPCTFFFVCLLV